MHGSHAPQGLGLGLVFVLLLGDKDRPRPRRLGAQRRGDAARRLAPVGVFLDGGEELVDLGQGLGEVRALLSDLREGLDLRLEQRNVARLRELFGGALELLDDVVALVVRDAGVLGFLRVGLAEHDERAEEDAPGDENHLPLAGERELHPLLARHEVDVRGGQSQALQPRAQRRRQRRDLGPLLRHIEAIRRPHAGGRGHALHLPPEPLLDDLAEPQREAALSKEVRRFELGRGDLAPVKRHRPLHLRGEVSEHLLQPRENLVFLRALGGLALHALGLGEGQPEALAQVAGALIAGKRERTDPKRAVVHQDQRGVLGADIEDHAGRLRPQLVKHEIEQP